MPKKSRQMKVMSSRSIEREKARKAFMINAQNERVTNKARERLAQLALHKYGGVRQMFECLDRNNDKELSLDEFSHALKRRNLEKLFPRRAARVPRWRPSIIRGSRRWRLRWIPGRGGRYDAPRDAVAAHGASPSRRRRVFGSREREPPRVENRHHTSSPRRDQQSLVYDAIDKDFSESVEVEEMVDWLEKDPRAAGARRTRSCCGPRRTGTSYATSVQIAATACPATPSCDRSGAAVTRDTHRNAGTEAKDRSPTKCTSARGPRRRRRAT